MHITMLPRLFCLTIIGLSLFPLFNGCQSVQHSSQPLSSQLTGTWQLQEGRLIENGDTSITLYKGDTSFIKIINKTHFAFLQHDQQKDSSGIFAAGGGRYTLDGNRYTEHLEYCNARNWEDNSFSFTIEIKGDTLIQSGVEKIDSLGINRINTEMYTRLP